MAKNLWEKLTDSSWVIQGDHPDVSLTKDDNGWHVRCVSLRITAFLAGGSEAEAFASAEQIIAAACDMQACEIQKLREKLNQSRGEVSHG